MESNRYPVTKPNTNRRRWLLLASVTVFALGIGIAWVGYQKFSAADVSGIASGYKIISPSRVEIIITVTRKNPNQPAVCIVRSRANAGNEVGRREIFIPASSSAAVTLTREIATSAPPVIAEVYGCSLTIPPYLSQTGVPG